MQAVPIDTLLADPDIEIVVNLTVPAAHAPVSLRIIEAGKHVYLEKPLATRFTEAGPVMQAAAAKGLRVGCAPDTFRAPASGLPLRDRRWFDRRPGRGRRILAVARHGTLASESGILLPTWRRTDPRYGPVLRDAACQSARAGRAWRTGLDREQDAPDHQRTTGRTGDHCRSATTVNGAVVRQWRQCVVESPWTWKHRRLPLEIYGSEGSMLAPDPNFFGASRRSHVATVIGRRWTSPVIRSVCPTG